MALAGTRQSEREKNNSMENDPKEIYEHQLVVKGLKQKLHTLGELNISPTYVWDIGPISHLRTDITVEFADKPNPQNVFNEISTLLHPTAALGVAPNTADWHFLKKCDGEMNRRRFGAPFGVLSPQGRSIALVAIRCLQWNEDQISIGAGCGIVAQSELQNEWQELELKKNTIKNMLGI
jgi:menaquinone-specific isochorismate synthase